MGEPAADEVPQKSRPRFSEQIKASAEFRRKNGVKELTEDEATELAVSEVKKVRQERRERMKHSN